MNNHKLEPITAYLRTARREMASPDPNGVFSISVPCGSCTTCCRAYEVVVGDMDDPDTQAAAVPSQHPNYTPGTMVLPKNAGGSCVFLTIAGCSIYDRRPQSCGIYDCRRMVYTRMRGDDPELEEVWDSWDQSDILRTEEDLKVLTILVAIRDYLARASSGSEGPKLNIEELALATIVAYLRAEDVRNGR